MDEIILKLLKDNGRIILPDFGALIVKQKSPFVVIFNEFLQYNDGSLIDAVEKHFQISKEEASEKVKNLIAEINLKLGKGEEIKLTGIGVLTKTPAGKITLSDPSQKKYEPEKESPKVSEEETPVVEFDLSEEKPIARQNNEPVIEQKKEDAPIVKPILKETGKKNEDIHKPEEKKVGVNESETKAKTKTGSDLPPITEYYNNQPEKNKKSIILWVLIILLVNGAIISYFIFSDEIKMYLSKRGAKPPETEITTNSPEVPEVTDDTTAYINNPSEDILVEEPEEYQQGPSNIAGTKYYIVAGVFKEEVNADKLVIELRNKGYNSEKFGKIGHMYAVSYDVFPSKQEADKFLRKTKAEFDPEAWIRIVD